MSRQIHVAVWVLMAAAVAVRAAEEPKAVVQAKAPMQLQAFTFGQVVLGAGPLKEAFETNVRYLHSLKPDRFLWTFRKNAGLGTPDAAYGGWEEPKCELRGHSMGHYLSACARVIAQTGDAELKKNADYTVAELARCQAKLGGGYLSAFPAEFFDRVDNGQKVWAPYYTIHKIMLGLWEMHAYAGNSQALDVLKGMADYFKGRCDKLNDEQMQKMLRNEFGGMHEVLLNLYSATGEKKYFDLAQRFVKNSFVDPLADGKDNLPGIHANTHIPQIAGQARAYELTGNKQNRQVVEFFWDTLISAHSYATGGSNNGEYWGPPNKLAGTLSANNQEFCTSYNLEKICRYLLKWTGENRYADMIERNFYNGILVSQEPKTGMFIYFLPLKTSSHKDHGSPFDTFTCCYGTGIQEYASLGQDVFYHSEDGLYVNLFANASVTWKSPRGEVRVTQQTDFPAKEGTSLKVSVAKPTRFKLAVRVPWWANKGFVVKVNGSAWEKTEEAKPATWLTINRAWNDNDTVEIAMPMSLHAETINDDPNLVAIMYGPMVLAGIVEPSKSGLDLPAPIFTGDPSQLNTWIKPVEGKALTFRTVGQPTDVTLIPIHKVVKESYGIYWRFAKEGSPALAEYQKSVDRIRDWQKRVIDSVAIGDEDAEKSHRFQGANTQSGSHAAGNWRHAGQGGFFSYKVKVDAAQENILAVSYWGGDSGDRIFDILVDGTRIATQTLNNNAPGKLFVVEYPIPRKLVAEKSEVVVRFEPAPNGKTAGGVFGLVVLRAEQAASAAISIEAAKTGQPMSKYIYGQFIEHLGRCIYGGIWAEMLEDRKFYFGVGVKESPWKAIGGEKAVTMVRESPFVGQHTPRVNLAGDGTPRGIIQSKLALMADKTYVGRIWLAGEGQVGPVVVSLAWGDDPKERQTIRIESIGSEFAKTPLRFTAGASTSNGRLEIVAAGSGSFRIGTLSLMPADNIQGMRRDTLELLKQLDSPVYRWPGGNFVSGYDWKDGIGDPDRRPPRKNPAWQGVEHNDFGMHEFMAFCRYLGTEPYIAVNSGLGDASTAKEEVEYANGSAETPMGKIRAQNGDAQPFKVKFWSIGNEMYGDWQLGHMSLEKYVEKHNQFAQAMRSADGTIELIGVGAIGPWSEGMLKNCADNMSLMSEHFYCQERPDLARHVRQIPDSIRKIAEAHRKYRQQFDSLKGKDIRIALDEWNYWYGPHVFGELGTRYFVKDGLGIAAGLNEYARNSDIIYMANYAQTVNVIGCIKTSKTAAAFETTGLVLKLYRQHFGTVPVATQTSGQLDAQAAWSADRKTLTIAIVNPTGQAQEIPLAIRDAKITGQGKRWQIAHADPMAYNDPDQPAKLAIEETAVSDITDKLSVAPCSVTLFALTVQ